MKCDAIVLHKAQWKESSFLVTLMTDKMGIIKAIVQGARKEKSPFFSLFELGNHLEIVLSDRPTASLYKLTDSTLHSSHLSLRGHSLPDLRSNPLTYPQLLSLQIALEMYAQLVITEAEAEEFFKLLLSFIEYLPSVKSNHLLVNWRFLIRLSDFLGFPIVFWEGNKYEFSDKEEVFKTYDEDFLRTIRRWLEILPNAGRYINEANILDSSCCLMNKFIFDWYNTHLNKRLHKNALEMYLDFIHYL
jgi:hypothetical protein